jgi:LPS-assembly protein
MHRSVAFCLSALLAVAPLPAAALDSGRGNADTARAPMLFSADEVQYDEDLGLIVAKGHVEINQQDQILLADTVTYNQRTDTVTASGHVSLLQPTGDIAFGDFVELHDNMRDGFIRNVRLLLSDRSRMAGNTALRIDGNRTEIRRGVYSPCEICREDPTRPPVWQIKGEEITHDKELQIVEYRDAVMEVDGVPIFYSPYFSHPDPSVKRHSGFLTPSPGVGGGLGYHVTVPYYWAIDQDKDATFSPMFTTQGGTFLGGEYRERFSNGQLTTDGSVTFGSTALVGLDNPSVANGVRGHLFANGELDLDDTWRVGTDIQRASDQTYLLRYHLPSPANFLTSRVYGEGFRENSYSNVTAWTFQSLQPGVGDSTQPIVAPIADYYWQSQPDSLGGRFDVHGNALDLARIQGISTRRLSLGSEWRLPFSDSIGERYGLSLSVRADGYHSDDLPIGAGPTPTESAFAGRVFPQLAFTWSYPWVRRGENYSELIEPVAMVAASTNGGNPNTIPNEDSQAFEFDETSLFLPNRFPGIDRVDSGQRVDYGLRAGIYDNEGGSIKLLVGQSYSLEKNPAFLVGSGLEENLSDVVGRVTVTPAPYLDFIYRFRLGNDDLALRRQEVVTNMGPANLRLSINYLQIAAIPDLPQFPRREQVGAALTAGLTRYWSLQLTGLRDYSAPIPGVPSTQTLNSGIALTYRDDCVAFVTSLSQSGVRVGDVTPGTALLFTIVFKDLGETGTRLGAFGGL